MSRIKNELWKTSATTDMLRKCRDLIATIFENKFVHLDFTPNNILFNDDGQFFVIDFEYSQRLNDIDTVPYVNKIRCLPLDDSILNNVYNIELEALRDNFQASEKCKKARQKIDKIISEYS